jgi:DNA-binding PadR family transcriptional regulator
MKYELLALLTRKPAHGYELKQTYERLFRDVQPPLNAGQIYTTLSRLERDGLVEAGPTERGDRPNKRIYKLKKAGKLAVQKWIGSPESGPRLKDRFFKKLILALATRIADPPQLIESQRRAYLQTLRDLNALAGLPEIRDNHVASLLIQGALLHLIADLEWLTLCEQALAA